jgi:hypothetical protein
MTVMMMIIVTIAVKEESFAEGLDNQMISKDIVEITILAQKIVTSEFELDNH